MCQNHTLPEDWPLADPSLTLDDPATRGQRSQGVIGIYTWSSDRWTWHGLHVTDTCVHVTVTWHVCVHYLCTVTCIYVRLHVFTSEVFNGSPLKRPLIFGSKNESTKPRLTEITLILLLWRLTVSIFIFTISTLIHKSVFACDNACLALARS